MESATSAGIRPAGSFDLLRPPVALEIDAGRLAASPALRQRQLDWISATLPGTAHLSVTLKGCRESRLFLASLLEERLSDEAPGKACLYDGSVSVDVLPRSALLAAERGSCTWSADALIVPPQTAWVPVEIDLADRVRPDGRVERGQLGEALDSALVHVDRCYETTCWPTPAMQEDAWLNRRAAVLVTGFCTLFTEFGYTLSALHQLTGWIGARLQSQSNQLARRTRPIPAIRETDPSRGMPAGELQRQWHRRWQRAASATAVRHRNLLVLSIADLVRREPVSGRLIVELLPLLQHADTIEIGGSHRPALEADEHALLEKRLRAALQQRHALDQIAKHI